MNVQTKTEPVHTVCTPLCLSVSLFFKEVFDSQCSVSKTIRGAFSPNMHFTIYIIVFYLKSVSYLEKDSFALVSVVLSLYVCFCVQHGQTYLQSDI